MGLFGFGKKKKKPARACELEGSLLEFGEGYLLTSSQIIKSKRFWDNKMIASNTYKLIFKDTGVQPLAGLSGLFYRLHALVLRHLARVL